MKNVVAIKLTKDRCFQDVAADGLLELPSGTVLKIGSIHTTAGGGNIPKAEASALLNAGAATPVYECDDAVEDTAEVAA